MSAARTSRWFWFHGREATAGGRDGALVADDSLELRQDQYVSNIGRVDPPHTPRSYQPVRQDDRSITGRNLSNWPVIFYVPNLLGYIRILLAFLGMKHSLHLKYNKALNTWIVAAVLDLIDGIAARKFNQCSQFGILLDIIADNILRTVVWISCMILVALERNNDTASSSANAICIWTAIICLEWTTMVCSQCNQVRREKEGHHWKDVKRKGNETSHPPFWVQAVFNNNFRSPSGILSIYGLFVAPLGSYAWFASIASTLNNNETWPTLLLSKKMVVIMIAIAYVGRILSAAVELWLCWQYLRVVLARDRCGGKNK